MRSYKTIIIVKPNLDETALKAFEEKYSNLINANGNIDNFKNMGVLQLGYEINKNKQGNYFEIEYKAEPTVQAELNRLFKIDDNILKYLTITK